MPVSVKVQAVQPRKLAAVRREVVPDQVGSTWGPAVGLVWDFLRSHPELWTGGHNIFVYHHPKHPDGLLSCDFGVEVTRPFERAGEVYATETPGGEAAVAIHRGPYDRMNEAYDAIEQWMEANGRESAGHRPSALCSAHVPPPFPSSLRSFSLPQRCAQLSDAGQHNGL